MLGAAEKEIPTTVTAGATAISDDELPEENLTALQIKVSVSFLNLFKTCKKRGKTCKSRVLQVFFF